MKRHIFKLILILIFVSLGAPELWAGNPETRRDNPDRDQIERVLRNNRQLKRETLRRIEALRDAIEEKEELLREQRAEIRVLERRSENTADAVAQKERIEQELRTLRSDLEALLDLHDNQEVTCDALETSLEREAEAIEELSADVEDIRDEADQENEEERVVDEERDSMFTLAGRVLAVVKLQTFNLDPENAFMFGMRIATQAQDLYALSPMLGELQLMDLMERITGLENERDVLIHRYENRRKTAAYRETLRKLDIKIQALSGAMLAYNQVMSQGGVPTTGYDVTGGGAAQTNPMQLYMMMSLLNGQNGENGGSGDDLMQLMLLSQMNGGQAQMDPMMLMLMSGGDDEMLPLLLMAQNGQIQLYDENGQPNQWLLQSLLDDGGSRRHRSRGESMGLEFMMGLGQDPYSSGI